MASTQLYSFFQLYDRLLKPERGFYGLVLIYGLAIGALTLSIPLSVQIVVGTVVNTALTHQVIVLAAILFALLALSSVFAAIQVYVMELFERRFFSRVVSEVALRLIYASPARFKSINRDDLINRYFDIMTVQKNLPPLLTGVFATVMQSAVGIAVTSFYHPVFLLFNIVVVFFAYLIYRSLDRGAARTSLELSESKYAAASWLETLSRANTFFKSSRTIDYALTRTANVREQYVHAHKAHFHFTFAQILGLLLLYTAASSSLLGIGGWLVIVGQLTIGQLVAAELIFSAIFYGLTRVGYYLELYYDLFAAMTKLQQLYQIDEEAPRRDAYSGEWQPHVSFEGVRYTTNHGLFTIDFSLAAGSLTLIETRSSAQVNAITELLLNIARPQSGRVLIGGHEVDDFNVQNLREQVLAIDETTIAECTIAEYLTIAAPGLSRSRARELINAVGLHKELLAAGEILDVRLTPHGHPLSMVGIVKLKIAFALAAKPKLIILSPLFDLLGHASRRRITEVLRGLHETTVICFSHRRDLEDFDNYLLADFDLQTSYPSLADLDAAYLKVFVSETGDEPLRHALSPSGNSPGSDR